MPEWVSSAAFGAVIGGVIVAVINYLIARETRKLDYEKFEKTNIQELEKIKLVNAQEQLKQRSEFNAKILIEVLNNIEAFNNQETEFWSLTVELLHYQSSNEEVNKLRSERWLQLLRGKAFVDILAAEAKLILIGESESAQLVREYGSISSSFREETIIKHGEIQKVSKAELSNIQQKRNSQRILIYKSLNIKNQGAQVISIGEENSNESKIAA